MEWMRVAVGRPDLLSLHHIHHDAALYAYAVILAFNQWRIDLSVQPTQSLFVTWGAHRLTPAGPRASENPAATAVCVRRANSATQG